MLHRTTKFHAIAISALLYSGCDAGPDLADDGRQTSSTAGKADSVQGSCAGAQQGGDPTCGDQGHGTCWCDAECAEYGDCCEDAASVCGVDTCSPGANDCASDLQCIELEGVFACRSACEEATSGAGTVACPPQWRLTSNSNGLAFCLREGLDTSDDAEGECDNLHDGVLAYSDPVPSPCPSDARTREDSTCAFEDLQPPPSARPYCDYVADSDVLGYYWNACPEGTQATSGPQGEQRCVLTPDSLPVDAQAYCHYIEDGYFGFSWSLTNSPSYTCPAGTRYAPNSSGRGYCLVEYDAIPGHVRAFCNPDAEFVGYEWIAGCGS